MATEFSTEVKQVAAVFKEYRNSIDIYTEDKEADKAFYVLLLQRLLKDTGVKINDVHPLGNKEDVIKACKADHDKRRPCLYIVDGDVFLQYQNEEPVDNLFRLDAYCIENYIICEESICKTAYELNGGRFSMENIKNQINYSLVLNNSITLIDLFFWYSIQSELFGQFEIRHIDAFFDMHNVCVDNQKINNRIDEIKRGLINNGYSNERINNLLQLRIQKFGNTISTLFKIVSGKDYLIPLFCNIIKQKVCSKISLPRESWKYQLSKTCDLNRLSDLKSAILAACA